MKHDKFIMTKNLEKLKYPYTRKWPQSLWGQICKPNSTIIEEICRHYLYTCKGNMPSSPRSRRTLEMWRCPYVWDGRTRTALPGMWCKARGPTWQWPWRIQWSDSQTGVHWWCYRYRQGSPLCHWCPRFGCCYRRSRCPRGWCQRCLNWRCRQWRRSPTQQHCLGTFLESTHLIGCDAA